MDTVSQSIAFDDCNIQLFTNLQALEITWLSTRWEYWPPKLGMPESNGIACLLFGVGPAGADFLTRLACSEWFTGLEPRAEDLAVAGGPLSGSWVVRASLASGEIHHPTKAAESFFTSARLPSAWYAAVAIPCPLRQDEQSAALGLVEALRKRSDPRGRKLSVVVTIEVAPDQATGLFVRRLLDLGAFVVRAGRDESSTNGDHVHHFPLRAVLKPRRGRLICVDLADYLYTWRSGSVADLYVVPFVEGDAEFALRRLTLPKVDDEARALNIGFHLDPSALGMPWAEIESFARECSELFLRADGHIIYTETDRLDGKGGSADLLLIRDGVEEA